MRQLAIAAGMIAALGAMLILREFRPRHPHAADTAARLTGTAQVTYVDEDSTDLTNRVGRAVLRHAGTWSVLRIPHRDLQLLRVSVTRFVGEKVLLALVGLLIPAAATVVASLTGLQLPFTIPAVAGLAMSAVLFFVPNWTIADKANTARKEWKRAMTCYVDLVALERAGGAGAIQSLEHAATIGDSWVFARLSEELDRARWSQEPAWGALRSVGEELRLPELVKTADVMRLAGDQGATVYENLRARASEMRNEQLTDDKARAGARTERAVLPVALTAIVFVLTLIVPMAMQLTTAG